MARYLVTGGAGFIGSHLCDALLARGDTVRVLDDLSSGHRANLPDGIEFQLGDIADPPAVEAAVEDVDGCFHLAAIASVARGLTDWLGTHRANLTGTIGVFDALRRTGRRVPVVYASSAAVYGDCPTLPITEDLPLRPLSAYGADKLGCELHARVATQVHGIPTVGLRFFNVYGSRQDPRSPYSGVISIFCDRLPRGDAIEIFGDGGQTRDFIHVSDVVAGLLAAMALHPAEASVANLCTGQPTSILALAKLVADQAGKPLGIHHAAPRVGEIRHSVGSMARARAMLGLGDPRPLRQGLQDVLTPPNR
ncbi:MAG: NAD-dependent epimerase/dehydratase family protein [Rhodospirillales bacterium]|nr:NAD-dependent epimerase/dehydratase family protein [Rhodospirillales bacterium]MBN8898814.1 NAD-dependent epimerase/dehydratase family protein [Rhodospirillales bacterium]MBN8908055.1 NAD-dependent epimerase/dehydratase family protein [Rhodospirillales bacterium]